MEPSFIIIMELSFIARTELSFVISMELLPQLLQKELGNFRNLSSNYYFKAIN